LWEFLGGLLLDSETARAYCAGGSFNTDEHPLLEFSTPRHLHERESKRRAESQAYEMGRASRLPITAQQVPGVLQTLNAKMPPKVALRSAHFGALRPEESELPGPNDPTPDIGVLNLEFTSPSVRVLVFPNTPRVPPSWQQFWQQTPDIKPNSSVTTKSRRHVAGNAALIGLQTPSSRVSLNVFLKGFEKGKSP
jgi:hypothetical protein